MEPATPEISQIPEAKKDSHWITILAMALFVLASLSVTAFLYYQNQALKKMLASYQSQSSPTPTSTTDPTAEWKIHTILTEPSLNLMNYQVKLPPTWVRVEHSSSFQDKETFHDAPTDFMYQLTINQEKNFEFQFQTISSETSKIESGKMLFDQILSTFKFFDGNEIPGISPSDLEKGWYWGSENQKKPGTPKEWIFTEAGKSSCWHKPSTQCVFLPD